LKPRSSPHCSKASRPHTSKTSSGSEFRDYLNTLKDWGIIDINDQYLNDNGEGFPKSYRLHPTALSAPKVKVCFRKKQVHPLRDNSKLTDDVA